MSGLLSFRAWEKVWMFRKTFLLGLGNTVKVAFLGLLLSLILGIVFGLMATGEKKILRGIARVYVEVIQNTPLLLQLCFCIMHLPFLPIVSALFFQA